MSAKPLEIIVDRDRAVFWLDANGCWQNKHGKFRHQKIIRHFHSSIKRDRHGYYLYQENGAHVEKVYFHYEDQALFVFDVLQKCGLVLVLNTRQQVKLMPQKLFIKDDNLYMRRGDEIIKFVEQGLVKIARFLMEENNRLYIRVNNRRYQIPALNE